MATLRCEVCGADFKAYAALDIRKTCSRECKGILDALNGKWTGPNNPRWKGGIGIGYYQIHRKDACERCGGASGIRLEVHHKDENRENNDPSNLETLCCSCHKKEHCARRKAIYGWSPSYKCCVRCGSTKGRHAAHGLCNACYLMGRPVNRAWNERRKKRLAEARK